MMGYYLKSRGPFKDGVYYFSLKNLCKYNNNLKELMKADLGE